MEGISIDDEPSSAAASSQASSAPPALSVVPAQSGVAQDKTKSDLERANRLLKAAKGSIDDLKQQLASRAEDYEKLKQEFQKFRIKAEVSRSQSASEIAR